MILEPVPDGLPMTSSVDVTSVPALRVVHLLDGLRAFDFGDLTVKVGPGEDVCLLTFPRPRYAQLYPTLSRLGLHQIGVDLVAHTAELKGLMPPDWYVLSQREGFAALRAERAWADVRHVPSQKAPEIIDFAGRFKTYHRLLSLRVRELSEAYQRCLRAQLFDLDGRYKPPTKSVFFSNGFLTYIDAAIHAFLADAAGLRDLIAEATWRLVLRETVSESGR